MITSRTSGIGLDSQAIKGPDTPRANLAVTIVISTGGQPDAGACSRW